MSDKYLSAGTYHLANNPDLYAPQRSSNFELHVAGLADLIRLNTTELDDNRVINNAAELLTLSMVSATAPKFSQNIIEVQYGNNKLKFAGKPTWDPVPLVINDFIGADGKSIILSWQAQSYDAKNQLIPDASVYKKIAWLHEYTPDWKLIRSWKLLGCWLSEVDSGSFSMENDDKRTVTATMQYDYALLEFGE